MLENKHFSAKHKTGENIKLRTDSGVIHDSCEANIGSLQGNCRSISAILCDGALDGEKWHVINRVHAQTGTFYDHIAVKGAVSEAQALRLCQKYFNPFENAVTKSIVAVGDNGLKLFLDSENTPTNTNFFLPQDAHILDSMVTLKPVEWSDNKLSSHGGTMSHLMLDMAMYDLSGELLEKVTPKDVVSMLVDEQCQFMMYDAMILKYSQLDLAVKKIAEALKQSDTEEFFVKEVTPIEPFKRQGVVNVGAIFEMSDTQTITVLFNNPDTTPAKLTSTDVITSWKWILNKRDVTAVLQPRAVDAKKYPMIANRMYQLLAKNHARFKRAQAVRNKDEALLAELIGQLEADQLEARMIEQQIADIQAKIDDIGVKKQQQSALEKDSQDNQADKESGQEKPLEAAIAKVKAITDLLISDFDFSYNKQSQSTNLIKELISANAFEVSIEINDEFGIDLSGELILEKIDTTGSIEYIARAIAQIDFEHGTDFSDTGEIEDEDSIFFGKSSDYAFTIQQLDQAAKQLKLNIVYDNFEATKASGGLFDSLALSKANLIYGVTAQIGKNNQVLVRAKVDFDGNLELLRGASGSEVVKAFNTDAAIKKNIVAALSDVISGNPIASESVEQAADNGDKDLALPQGFRLDADVSGNYWVLYRDGLSEFTPIFKKDDGTYRAQFRNSFSSFVKELDAAVQWGVNVLSELHKQQSMIPAQFDKDKFLKAIDLTKAHSEKKGLDWNDADVFRFVQKKFTDFENAHKDLATFEIQADILNNGLNDLSRVLFGLYTNGDVVLKGLSQKAGKTRMAEYAKEIFTKDQFDQYEKDLKQTHKAALEKKQQEQLRELEFQVSSYMSGLSTANQNAIKKWFNEGFDPIPVKVGVATRYQFVNEKEGVKYKIQNNSTYRELESTIKAANAVYGSMREALIHLGYLERQADEPTAVEDTAAATVFEPTITRYNIKSTNPRARKPVGSVKLTSREDGMSEVLFVMDGVGGEYVGTIEDVQKWVAMRMQGLGSAAAGEETTFSDVKPRLTLVEGEDLLGVNGAPSQPIEQVQTVPPVEESAVNNADVKMTGSAAQRLPFLASALVSLGEGWVKDGDTAIKNIQFENGITDVFRLILSDNGRDFLIVDNDNRVAAVQYDDFKTENGANNAAININNRINEQVAYLNELYSGGAKSHQGESAVNENEKFLNDVIAGAVDLGADATGERLEQIGEDLDPALEDLFEQAAEVYAQFAINNAQSA